MDAENAAQGIKGCDAIWPYDSDAAYVGMKEWAELLLAEWERLREELWIARRHGIEHEWVLNEDFYFCCQVCGFPAPTAPPKPPEDAERLSA